MDGWALMVAYWHQLVAKIESHPDRAFHRPCLLKEALPKLQVTADRALIVFSCDNQSVCFTLNMFPT